MTDPRRPFIASREFWLGVVSTLAGFGLASGMLRRSYRVTFA